MKKNIIFIIFTLMLFFSNYTNSHAQSPFLFELRGAETLSTTMRYHVFGIYLNNPVSIYIGAVEGTVITGDPNYVNDFSNLYFTVPRGVNDVTGTISLTTTTGSTTSFFMVTIPALPNGDYTGPLNEFYQVTSDYFKITHDSESLTKKVSSNVFEIQTYSTVVPERGIFVWVVDFPVSNPAPQTRFANPDDTFSISDHISYGASSSVFENAMASIGYIVSVDSVVNILNASENIDSTMYYFTWRADRPTVEYPLQEGLGNSWVVDIDSVKTSMISGNVALTYDGTNAEFSILDNADAVAQSLLGWNITDTIYAAKGGYTGMNPRWLVELYGVNNLNSITVDTTYIIYGGIDSSGNNISVNYLNSYSFGDVGAGGSGKVGRFFITNTSNSVINIGSNPISIAGVDSNIFSLTTQPDSIIASGDSTFFDITCNPDTLGSFDAIVYVSTDYDVDKIGIPLNSTSTTMLPVELTSFTASVIENKVLLNWTTATEVNNYGFSIERQISIAKWEEIGFEEGYGNSNSTKEYSYIDNSAAKGNYSYRLKQIDINGNYEYSNVVEVNVTPELPTKFELSQNYPNPFNPTTKIEFEIPVESRAKLEVYNILGESVEVVIDQVFQPGKYKTNFNGSNLASGIYFYKLNSGQFSQIRKMVLAK